MIMLRTRYIKETQNLKSVESNRESALMQPIESEFSSYVFPGRFQLIAQEKRGSRPLTTMSAISRARSRIRNMHTRITCWPAAGSSYVLTLYPLIVT